MKGFIVSSDYTIINDSTEVHVFGRLENGESFVARFPLRPYFFISKKDAEKHAKLLGKFDIETTKNASFSGESLVKVSSHNHILLNKLVHALHGMETQTYEADIKPPMRFLIDNNIFGSLSLEGHYESSEKINRIYNSPEIKSVEFSPKLKVISIDIESSKNDGKLFCIGLYSEDYEKTFMVTKQKLKNVVSCSTEEECLSKFHDEIISFDPDIITGWNIIDFDLSYLKTLFRKYKMPFDIGRTQEEVKLRLETNFMKSSSADIAGRQVIDAYNLIKDPYIQEAPSIRTAEFESYSLEAVSQAILGKGKLIKGKNRHEEIEEIYSTNQQKLVDYNILDCKLAYEILHKSSMLDLAIERSQLTGMPLDKIGGSVAAFDSLYIREARRRNLASPTTRFNTKETGITGGYVMSPKPGIYKNVVVLDFKSLYPSMMRTFNIDPASYISKKEPDAIESPNKAYFKNTDGILSVLIEKMHNARERAKKEKRELASYAIKTTMNSFFGVLANPNCRYFNYDMANAVTHFGQMIIKLTASEIEKKGYNVIYADTDSNFVETKAEKEKANAIGRELRDYINSFYEKYIKENYNRKSFLEIQFDKQYLSMIIPGIRSKNADAEKAAKKRYAGLVEKNGKETLEVVGLEAIRGDWTEAARDFQKELLMKLFHQEPLDKFIKDYIKKIRAGKIDEKLIYRKSIRKDLEEYTKTTPPHVKAARQLDSLESNIIEYCITLEGPEPIQKLRHPLDYDHYIKKQIEPIANQVLSLLGKSLEDLEKNSTQAKLF